jgi:hypothetical protein
LIPGGGCEVGRFEGEEKPVIGRPLAAVAEKITKEHER